MNVVKTKHSLLVHLKPPGDLTRASVLEMGQQQSISGFFLTANLHLYQDNLISFCSDLEGKVINLFPSISHVPQ